MTAKTPYQKEKGRVVRDTAEHRALEEENEGTQNETPEEQQPKPMNSIQKVQYMHSLTEIAEDESIKSSIISKKNGQQAYDLFIHAISEKIDEIMNEQDTKKEQQTQNTLIHSLSQLTAITQQLSGLVHSNQLLGVLAQLNQKLGGVQLATNTQQTAQPQPPQNTAPQQRQDKFNNSYAEPTDEPMPSGSTGGKMEFI